MPFSRFFHGLINGSYTAYESPISYQNSAGQIGYANPFGPAPYSVAGATHDMCFQTRCDRSKGSEQNYAVFGIQAQNDVNNNDINTQSSTATVTMNWANVFLGDRRLPYIVSAPPPRGWIDDLDAPQTANVRAYDQGLGVYGISLSGAHTGNGTRRPNAVAGATPCTGDYYRSRCPADWTTTFSYTLKEGINAIRTNVHDVVENYGQIPANSTVYVDRTPPTTPVLSGTMFDARNRSDDRRFQGLDAPSYALNATSSDAHSGLKEIEIYIGDQSQRAKGGYTTTGTLDWTLNTDDLADGVHTVKVIARDHVAGQPGIATNRHQSHSTFDITIDRRGDIYTAEQMVIGDGEPRAPVATHAWRAGTVQARFEDETRTMTLGTTVCPADMAGCLTSRTAIVAGDIRAMHVLTGAAARDDRVGGAFELFDAAGQTPPGVTATGPLNDVLEPWQNPPPGHGATYTRYDTTEDAVIDGEVTEIVRQLFVDAATKLPIRRVLQVGSAPPLIEQFSYSPQRRTVAEVSPDFFDVAVPAGTTAQREDLGPQVEEPADPPSPNPAEDAAHARGFRQQFGLDDSDDAIAAASANMAPKSEDTFGVPLSALEMVEMSTRLALEDVHNAVETYGLNRSSTYAGSWIDHAGGGILRVGFTSEAASHLDALRALVPELGRVAVYEAAHTLSHLWAVRDQISADLAAGTLAVHGVRAVSLDERAGRVFIGLDENTEAARNALTQRYGAAVSFEEADPTQAKLYAGATIQVGPRSDDEECTAGWTAIGRRGDPKVGGPRPYVKLTAGHCAERPGDDSDEDGIGDSVFYDRGRSSSSFTAAIFAPAGKSAPTDVAAFPIPPKDATSLISTSTSSGDRFLKVLHGYAQPRAERVLCQHGKSTRRLVCGVVRRVGYDAEEEGDRVYRNMVVVDFGTRCAVRRGDSGGPAFSRPSTAGSVFPGGLIQAFDPRNGRGCDPREVQGVPGLFRPTGSEVGIVAPLLTALNSLRDERFQAQVRVTGE